jgi:SSS family solute:Na+ symporter
MFYVGMLATIMSTLNTLAFVSAQTLGRDLIMRIGIRGSRSGGTSHSTNTSTFYTQIGLIISLLLSIILAVTIPSVIQMWYTIGTVVIPGLLIPLMASYFEPLKIPARYAFLAMLAGWLTSFGWLIAGNTNSVGGGMYPFGIEPMYPGLLVAFALWGIGRAKQKYGFDRVQ